MPPKRNVKVARAFKAKSKSGVWHVLCNPLLPLSVLGGLCMYLAWARGEWGVSMLDKLYVAQSAASPPASAAAPVGLQLLPKGCTWDIAYNAVKVAADGALPGGCYDGQRDKLDSCCKDAACAALLWSSARDAGCQRLRAVPREVLDAELDVLPLDRFDSRQEAKRSVFIKKTGPSGLPFRPATSGGGAAAPSGAAAPMGGGEKPPASDATSSVPQSLTQEEARRIRAVAQREASDPPRPAEDEIHCAFTIDCRPFNIWQGELLFFSALRVGHRGPITEIATGCDEAQKEKMLARHRELGFPSRFKFYFTPAYNDAKSIWINKPMGVRTWWKTRAAERDVVAVIDPDFAFIRPFTAAGGRDVWRPKFWEGEVPDRVQKGMVVSQRYLNLWPSPTNRALYALPFSAPNMTSAQLLRWVCSGSVDGETGCAGLTQGEISTYHSGGVPYIAHRSDWDWLVDDWAEITMRLHKYANKGFYVDMFSFTLANAHRRQRQLLSHNLMLSAPGTIAEEWGGIDFLAERGDSCAALVDPEQAAAASLAPFLHYCITWKLPYPTFGRQDQIVWSKYWFDWQGGAGARSAPTHAHVNERCNEDRDFASLKKLYPRVPVMAPQEILALTVPERRTRFYGCSIRSLFVQVRNFTCHLRG